MGPLGDHEHPRASTSILCAAQPVIAHGSMGGHEHRRASTSILCAAQVGIAHGSMGEHEHPRASTSILCAAQVGIDHGYLHGRPPYTSILCAAQAMNQKSLMGPWDITPPRAADSITSILCATQGGIADGPMGVHSSTSSHEHPVRCTGRNRSWTHGSAPLHKQPRASCALHR